MRWFLFDLWFGVTVALFMISASDYFFGGDSLPLLGRRLLMAVLWPFAILSTRGRSVLFNLEKDL